uniref:Uncharacterized protein n=1 Tax=Rhizophora mucronata TaxID=61149 RepID=A0A2P2NHM8_RHIMU
MNAAPIVSPRP